MIGMQPFDPNDPLHIFAGQAKPAVDPLPILMRLLAKGREASDCIGTICHYCGEDKFADGIHHASDCPYVEAVILFGDPNAKDKPQGILKA